VAGLPAVALLAGLALYPALAGDRLTSVVAGIGAAGLLVFAVGLAGRWPLLLAWGLTGFGAEYAFFLRLRGGAVEARAPFLAAVLLLVAELGFESISADGTASERELVVRTALATAAAVTVTAFAGGLLLLLGSSANSGLVLEGVGVAATVAAVALVVRVGSRARASS